MRIDRFVITSDRLLTGGSDPVPSEALLRLRDEFPSIWIREGTPAPDEPVVTIGRREWCARGFDPARLDARIAAAEGAGGAGLHLVASDVPLSDALPVAEEILTRCQRLFGRRNRDSASAQFAAVMRRSRALHDCGRPLGRAEHEHALDAWQWTLRLDPAASFALQVAALFHAASPESADGALFALGIDGATRARVAAIVALGARGAREDRDATTLADALSLSFFSFASGALVDYHGIERVRGVARTALTRLSPERFARLSRLRMRPDVEALVRQLDDTARAA